MQKYVRNSLFILILSSAPAFAAGGSGLMSGLLHPVLGFDHLMAMVAVGLLSVQLGGKHIWGLPAAFVLFLAIGGALGLSGVALPQVEGIIALSVLALGLSIAVKGVVGLAMAYPMVAVFALFHGAAHGTEIPSQANPASYVLGFVIASAVLHLIGVGTGTAVKSERTRALLGAGCAGIGLHLVFLTYGLV